MKETQNNEWKQSWHDDYLKCICGLLMHRVVLYILEKMI